MSDLTVGIDVGSTYTKAALLGSDGTLVPPP
jgi:activator of 2-hydroxyglutaryl-CoA dehydratase